MSLDRQVIKGFVWLTSAGMLSNIGRVAIFAILSRVLTKTDFGIYAAANVVIGISAMFGEMGFGSFLLQRKKIEQRHSGTAFVSVTALSVGVMLFLKLGAGIVSNAYRIPEIKEIMEIFAPLVMIKSFSTLHYFKTSRELRFKLIAKIETLSYFFGFGLSSIGFALAGFGYWSLLMGTAVQISLNSLLYLFMARHKFVICFDCLTFREMARFGLGTSTASIFSNIGREGDYFVVGRTLGPLALGLYNRAFVLMQLPVTAVVGALDRVLLPILSKAQDDAAMLRRTLAMSVRLIYLLYLPMAAVGALVAPMLIRVFLGPQWDDAVTPFRLLMLGLVFRAGYKMAGSIILARGKSFTSAAIQVAYAVAILTGAFTGSFFGLNGVCLGVAGALAINFAITNYCAARMIDLPLSVYIDGIWRAIPLTSLAGLTTCLALWLTRINSWSPMLQMSIAIPLALLITGYVAYMAMENFFPMEICNLLRQPLAIFPSRSKKSPVPGF